MNSKPTICSVSIPFASGRALQRIAVVDGRVTMVGTTFQSPSHRGAPFNDSRVCVLRTRARGNVSIPFASGRALQLDPDLSSTEDEADYQVSIPFASGRALRQDNGMELYGVMVLIQVSIPFASGRALQPGASNRKCRHADF